MGLMDSFLLSGVFSAEIRFAFRISRIDLLPTKFFPPRSGLRLAVIIDRTSICNIYCFPIWAGDAVDDFCSLGSIDGAESVSLLQAMELLSCSSALASHSSHASLGWKLVGKNGRRLKPFRHNQDGIPSAGPNSRWISRTCRRDRYRSKASSWGPQKIFSCYVAEGDMALGDVSRKAGSASKVSIPSLPEELHGTSSSPISSSVWEWKPKLNVHYERAGAENIHAPAVLFLPGFGVGSFHYEKQLRDLGRDYRVWALDFLGQGRSLPFEDPAPLRKSRSPMFGEGDIWGFGEEPEPWAQELVYSIDLWQEQVSHFIDQVPTLTACLCSNVSASQSSFH